MAMTRQILYREDGRVERLCEHGIGHPDKALTERRVRWQDWMGVHGCCGCCVTSKAEATHGR